MALSGKCSDRSVVRRGLAAGCQEWRGARSRRAPKAVACFRGWRRRAKLSGGKVWAPAVWINIPNQITLGRLVLTIVFFGLLSFYSPADAERQWILTACFWIFLVAALGDVLDGWLARTWKQVTSFGRISDPVVDKVMICGAFAFFASSLFYDPQEPANITFVQPWMVVVILLRELLVSGIRSFSEAHGASFAATWVGKLKMFVQSTTVCVVLGVQAWYPETLAWLRIQETCVWLTVIITGLSIIAYVRRARAFVLSASALGGAGTPRRAQVPGGLEPASPASPPNTSESQGARV
jgi:CDP-diacylglycerol--glycerol-3-phosphate 3-phosphatidyltransferase